MLIVALVNSTVSAQSDGEADITFETNGLRIHLGAPVTLAVAPEEVGWGFYQFPNVSRWADGTLCLTYNIARDAPESYGSPRAVMVSRDGGETWTPYSGKWGAAGLLLPNGDRIGVATPAPYKVADLKLPEPAGVLVSSYGKQKYTMYRPSDLPRKLRTIRISRLPKGSDERKIEHAWVDDPQALRYSIRDVFPIIWWGDLRLAPDGSILAGIYPGSLLCEDGSLDPKRHVFFYRSTDFGRTWKVQGRTLYQPDLKADTKGDQRDGFSEPTFEVLSDGSLICIMRTTDGVGIGPMYASRSTDMGKTWSKPRVIAPSGVLPKLLKLENGILAVSSGRPGVQLRFCADGKGKEWTDPIELVPVVSKDPHADTCGYTGLVALGPERFLLVYSHFNHINEQGRKRKAILLREVRVSR
jgi:hypothetical protein